MEEFPLCTFCQPEEPPCSESVVVAGMISVDVDSVLTTKWKILEVRGYGGEVRMRERSVVWMRKDGKCRR